MGRKRLVSKKDITPGIGAMSKLRCFWRDSFIGFIRPLRMLYRDPMSAGAHILSAYLADPINAKLEFTGSPDAFGALRDEADLARAKDTYEELVTGRSGPTLQRCAEQFEEQREASAAIAKFADELPKLYWELQYESSEKFESSGRFVLRYFVFPNRCHRLTTPGYRSLEYSMMNPLSPENMHLNAAPQARGVRRAKYPCTNVHKGDDLPKYRTSKPESF